MECGVLAAALATAAYCVCPDYLSTLYYMTHTNTNTLPQHNDTRLLLLYHAYARTRTLVRLGQLPHLAAQLPQLLLNFSVHLPRLPLASHHGSPGLLCHALEFFQQPL